MTPTHRAALALGGLLLASSLAQVSTAPATPATPSYRADIQPILDAQCAACHRPGGIAPFALQTYQDAAPRAALIAAVTGARIMPPWMPGGKTPPLKYARVLTDAQIKTLADWAASGARE